MKKLLFLLLIAPIIGLSAYLWLRYQKNIPNVVPYPYTFQPNIYKNLKVDAPILIVGDRLGVRLASFSKIMAQKMSQNLSKPIKIETLATKGEGLHRTLEKIKALPRLPLIIIYLGGSQETYESQFNSEDIAKINANFELYKDDRFESLFMVVPELSRFFYEPIHYKVFGEKIVEDKTEYDDVLALKRNEVQFRLYEAQLKEFFNYVKDHNSYLLAISQPLNLDVKPKKSCEGSFDQALKPQLDQVVNFIKDKDFKAAYNISKELSLIANNNARIHYIHGKIAKNLGKFDEAIKSLEMAMAFDCKAWRGSPIYQAILKKVAGEYEISYFDFHRMLTDQWTQNITFFDDIYPQNLYMEKLADVLAGRIKKLLKL